MKTKHILLLIPVMFAISLFLAACSHPNAPAAADPNVDHYTCAMHPTVTSQDPNAKCPVCGMGLVPVLKKPGTNAPAMPAH